MEQAKPDTGSNSVGSLGRCAYPGEHGQLLTREEGHSSSRHWDLVRSKTRGKRQGGVAEGLELRAGSARIGHSTYCARARQEAT